MKNLFNKRKVSTAFALILIVSMGISMLSFQDFASAAGAKTYPFVEAVPNPVGVGQRTLINFGLINFLMTDGDGWNVTLSITDPSGHTSTIDRMTWSTGTVGYSFLPETNGTYILKCSFDESWYNSTYSGWFGPQTISQYMESSETEDYELVVTNEAVASHPGHALPSEYWSRPIDPQLRE